MIYPAIPKDMKLSKETPPAFLACGEDDRQNISQGLPELYLAMKKAGAEVVYLQGDVTLRDDVESLRRCRRKIVQLAHRARLIAGVVEHRSHDLA